MQPATQSHSGSAGGEEDAAKARPSAPLSGWVSFWNAGNSIYVSARHRDLHFQTIADDIRAYVPGSDADVLDYGCGEALSADRVAAAAGRLVLSDAAPAVRERLAARFAGNARIGVRAPEDIAALPDASFDLIVLNSVAQYLAPEELDRLLALFRRLLKPGGRAVIGGVVPPNESMVAAALALLRFAAAKGFFLAAVGGLARTALSDYRSLRARLGLTTYEERAFAEKLVAAGFSAHRAAKNIGYNPARMTFVAEKR